MSPLIEKILSASRVRLEDRKRKTPIAELRAMAADAKRSQTSFRAALNSAPFSIIAEVKRRSPSSGDMSLANVRDALSIYNSTESVAAISILTDEDHFGNTLVDLREARKQTDKPLLRKDFIEDEYQVWEARAFGADAVLIMSGLHAQRPSRAAALVDLAKSLRMDVLFELGMMRVSKLREHVQAINADDVIWGVNSRRFEQRDLTPLQLRRRVVEFFGGEFRVDTDVHAELRKVLPSGRPAVAESGVKDPKYLRRLMQLDYRAALIGTAFLKEGVEVGSVVREFDAEVSEMTKTGTIRSVALRSSRFPSPTT
jgi:indole-3-glycerol phosphate synthase